MVCFFSVAVKLCICYNSNVKLKIILGIPFLTLPDEQVLRDELLNRYKQNCMQTQTPSKVSDDIPIPDNHKEEVENAW